MSKLTACFDETPVELSDDFVAGLHSLMESWLEMMRKAEPTYADCWKWGVCRVGDLASSDGLRFEFGGLGDKPRGMRGTTHVEIAQEP